MAVGPRVIDRGTGYVAIDRSLLAYGGWLEWHHRDAALVERAYQPGSRPQRVMTSEIATLRRERLRLVEVDRVPSHFSIISIMPNVVTFRLTEYLARRELVDENGRIVDRVAPVTEHYLVSIMRLSADAPWRVNLVDHQRSKIEVQL